MGTESTLGPARPALLLTESGPEAGRTTGRADPGLSSRSRRGLSGLMLALGLAASGTSAARAASGAASSPDGTRSVVPAGQGDPVTAMKGDLRRLVSANEVYHVKNSKYAADVGALSSFRPTPGVTVTLLSASANGWAAKATAAALPGKSCVIYVGAVPTPPKTDVDARSGPEAVAVCDKP